MLKSTIYSDGKKTMKKYLSAHGISLLFSILFIFSTLFNIYIRVKPLSQNGIIKLPFVSSQAKSYRALINDDPNESENLKEENLEEKENQRGEDEKEEEEREREEEGKDEEKEKDEEREKQEEEKRRKEEEKAAKRKEAISDAGGVLGVFLFFLILSIYSFTKLRYLPDDLLYYVKSQIKLFLYVTNNGFFLISLVQIIYYRFTWEEFMPGYILFICSAIFFLVGTIAGVVIIRTLLKTDEDFPLVFFSFGTILVLITLPFKVVWKFIGLADDCCRSESYTNYYDKDGNLVESTYACHCGWNCFLYWFKKIILIFTIFIYYASVILLMIILLIVILCNNLCCKKPIPKEKNDHKETLVKSEDTKDINEEQATTGDNSTNANNLVNMNNIPDDYGQQNNEENPGF